MLEYLEIFLPELYPFFSYLIEEILKNPIVAILFGSILVLGVTGAIIRMIFS